MLTPVEAYSHLEGRGDHQGAPCWMFGSNQSRRFQLSSCVCLHYLFPTAYKEQQFNSKAPEETQRFDRVADDLQLVLISGSVRTVAVTPTVGLKSCSVKPSCSVAEVFYSSRQSLSVLLLVFYLSFRDPKKNWLFRFRSRLSEITVSTDSTQASKDIYLNIYTFNLALSAKAPFPVYSLVRADQVPINNQDQRSAIQQVIHR